MKNQGIFIIISLSKYLLLPWTTETSYVEVNACPIYWLHLPSPDNAFCSCSTWATVRHRASFMACNNFFHVTAGFVTFEAPSSHWLRSSWLHFSTLRWFSLMLSNWYFSNSSAMPSLFHRAATASMIHTFFSLPLMVYVKQLSSCRVGLSPTWKIKLVLNRLWDVLCFKLPSRPGSTSPERRRHSRGTFNSLDIARARVVCNNSVTT